MLNTRARLLAFTCGALLTVPAKAGTPPAATPPSGYQGLGAASVSPEIVARYAAKPLDPAVSRRVQSLLDLRAPGRGIFSPDGKRLFFTWSVTGTNQVWRIDGAQHFPVQMTGGEDATNVADITPDGKWLVLSRDRRGEENPGLYLQSTDGGELHLVQHKPGLQAIAEFVSDDSRYLYFRSNDRSADAYAIYRYDLQTRERTEAFTTEGLWHIDDHRADGKWLLRKSTGSRWAEYSLYDPASKALTPLFGQNEQEEYDRTAFGAGADEILVLTPKLGQHRRIYRFEHGKFVPITPELAWDVSDFSIDEARQHIFYTVNEGGLERLHVLDAKTLGELRVGALPPADSVTVSSTTRDGRITIVQLETAKAPPTAYAIDWTAGTLTQWLLPSSPEVDTSAWSVAAPETYPARDGTPIPMLVRRPERPCDGPCPVIVAFHGGPDGQATPGFRPLAQLFVDAGFVYVEPNVRGSDGYGKTWLNADNGPKRLATITDIEDCARYLRTSWAKDGVAPKLGVFGVSYGGYSVLMAMTRFAGAYDAGVSVVGIANLETFLRNTAPYRRMLRATEYGDPDKNQTALRQLSPITYIDRVKAPLMLIQGVSDPRVPVGEALQIHDALAARGVASELILFADEGHGAQKRDNRVLQYGHALRFFEEHLQGKTP